MRQALWQGFLVLALCATAALGGYVYALGQRNFDDCPPTPPQGVALYRIDTLHSRTCVYHPPVYGRAQHRMEMKRKERGV